MSILPFDCQHGWQLSSIIVLGTKGRVMIYVGNNKYQPARLYHNSDPFVLVWEFYFSCYHPEIGSPFFVQMAR